MAKYIRDPTDDLTHQIQSVRQLCTLFYVDVPHESVGRVHFYPLENPVVRSDDYLWTS